MNPVPFPIIDAEFGRRLFDSDLVWAVRESGDWLAYLRSQLANYEEDLKTISVPGFRFPNPAVRVARIIEHDKAEIARLKAEIEREIANPNRLPSYDELSFAGKVYAQLSFVAPMPSFHESHEESAETAARFDRYARKVTAEAEIIALWNSL